MRKIDFSQTFHILANIGVIAGIAFLAFELRQNNDLLEAEARARRTEIRISGADLISSNPELNRALTLEAGRETLTPEQDNLLRIYWGSVLTRWQYVYGEHRRGLIDEDDVPIADWGLVISQSPILTEVWRERGTISYRPDFVRFMEENIVSER